MKIETKWSLRQVDISSWCYSDWNSTTIVVSWNTYDEAKNAVKIFFQSKFDWQWNGWLIFNDWEKWQYNDCSNQDEEDRWEEDAFDSAYWGWNDVIMKRLEVIYDWWEVSKQSLHIK